MILEAVLFQTLAGQNIVNRWNYVGSGTPVGVTMSQALITAMGGVFGDPTPGEFPADTIINAVQAIQSADAQFIEMIARNIYPSADFYELPYVADVGGGVASPSLAPFNAIGLTTTRVTTAIRRGQKRIAGVPASFTDGEGVLTSAANTLVSALADLMGDTLTYTAGGNSLTFTPCIVHKEKYTTPAGNPAYRYYSTEAVQLTHLAQGFTWSGKTTVRSQTSRQYGRGS